MMNSIEETFNLCLTKLENVLRDMPRSLPEYYACGSGDYFKNYEMAPHDFMKTETWQPSFFTGEALIAYEATKDEKYLDWLNTFKKIYREKIFEKSEFTMHDVGFLYLLYSVGAYRVTGEEEFRIISLKAADELAKRYNVEGEFIRAWGIAGDLEDGRAGVAIIDCMMNLSLLFWATEVTGNPFYKGIAVKHANTVMKYFVRDDYSVYHAYQFNPLTGEPIKGTNFCGYGDESHWARGASWAIYGFTNCYRHTRDKKYLDIAVKICEKFINTTKQEDSAEVIPPWDFRLPQEIEQSKDTSAAIITASAICEILKYEENEQFKTYLDDVVEVLLSDKYLDKNTSIPGIVKESNGLHHYTLFGDYYFMELLAKLDNNYISIW